MPFDPSLPVNNSPVSSAELRAQFNSLKDLIDALQMEFALVPPGVPQIDDAQSADPGTLVVTASASRALELTVLRKGPSDADFMVMGNISSGGSTEETGLESGTHAVKAFGFNGGGNGPESATVEVTVG